MIRELVKFGEFELDAAGFHLQRSGHTVKLERIPMELLILLVERPGELVTREEIIAKFWGNAFLDTDNAVNTAVRKIRQALEDSPEQPRFVQTVSGKGYRFVAQVDKPAAAEQQEPSAGPGVVRPTPELRPRSRLIRRWNVVAAGVVTVALAFVIYSYLHKSPKLTDKDTIVLADFANTTGDPVFDHTLRQGLAVQLEQSPFLSLISDERIRQTLRLMGQPLDERLTPEFAREICERTAGTAVLEGAIANLGSQYVLSLRAT
jgi:eukaryotic-like serine/threonine-protein kinase